MVKYLRLLEEKSVKIVSQFLIIAGFTFIGDSITALFKLPIPGSIIGLCLLFAALQFKLIKVSSVEMVGTWLKNNLAFFFVPVTVGIMIYFDVLQATWVEFVIILIISTLVTYVVSAYTATRVQGDK